MSTRRHKLKQLKSIPKTQIPENSQTLVPDTVLLRHVRKTLPARRNVDEPQTLESNTKPPINANTPKHLIPRFIALRKYSFTVFKCSKPSSVSLTNSQLVSSLTRHIFSSLNITKGNPSESLSIEIAPLTSNIKLDFTVTEFKFMIPGKRRSVESIFLCEYPSSLFLFVDCSNNVESAFLGWYTKVFDVIFHKITFQPSLLVSFLTSLLAANTITAVQNQDLTITFSFPPNIQKSGLDTVDIDIPNSVWMDSESLEPNDFFQPLLLHFCKLFHFTSPSLFSVSQTSIGGLFIDTKCLSISNWSTIDLLTAISILLDSLLQGGSSHFTNA